MTQITIKEATIIDIQIMAKLFDEYRVFYKKEPDYEGAKQFIIERIINKESVIFIAEIEGVACGYIQLYPIFSSTRMKKYWLLNDLYVSKEFRKKGMAKLLLEKAKEFAIQTKSAGYYLETATDNYAANALYKAVGLKLDDAHNYYLFINN